MIYGERYEPVRKSVRRRIYLRLKATLLWEFCNSREKFDQMWGPPAVGNMNKLQWEKYIEDNEYVRQSLENYNKRSRWWFVNLWRWMK